MSAVFWWNRTVSNCWGTVGQYEQTKSNYWKASLQGSKMWWQKTVFSCQEKVGGWHGMVLDARKWTVTPYIYFCLDVSHVQQTRQQFELAHSEVLLRHQCENRDHREQGRQHIWKELLVRVLEVHPSGQRITYTRWTVECRQWSR